MSALMLISLKHNINNNAAYIKAIANNEVPFQLETLTAENKINEYVFTTLRTMWGCDLDSLRKEYQHDLLQQNEAYISKLIEKNLATLDKNILKLTKEGKLLADQIALDLMV